MEYLSVHQQAAVKRCSTCGTWNVGSLLMNTHGTVNFESLEQLVGWELSLRTCVSSSPPLSPPVWFDAMINLKSMSLSALAVIQSTRAFSLNAAAVSPTRYRPYRHLPRCQHTDTAARRTREGGAKQQATRVKAGASPGSPSPVLGRGREVSRRSVARQP